MIGWFRRRSGEEWMADWSLASRWHDLGRYNSEVGHGIVHTSEYNERMAADQAAFDAETEAEREARYAAARRVRYMA